MNKVEKCISDTTEWLNNIINIQAKQNLDQDPVVRVNEIRRKLRVSFNYGEDLHVKEKAKFLVITYVSYDSFFWSRLI